MGNVEEKTHISQLLRGYTETQLSYGRYTNTA